MFVNIYIKLYLHFQSDVPILGELTMPLVISVVHLVFPFIFARMGSLERYENPKTELYIGMVRYYY